MSQAQESEGILEAEYEGELQGRIEQARAETRQLYAQIEKVRAKTQDAELVEMARNVAGVTRGRVNLGAARQLRGHGNKIADVCWGRDSTTVVSASQDGFMIVWDAATGLKRHAVPLDSQWVLACAVAPSGRLVANAGLNNNCTIYRVPQGAAVQQNIVSIFKGHTGYVSAIEFLGDAQVVTASGDMTCALWDIPQSKRVREYADHLGDVLALAYPRDLSRDENAPANLFASAGSDGYTYIWDTRAPASVQNFFVSDSDVNALQFFNGEHTVVTGSDDGSIHMFDLRADCAIAKYNLPDSHSRKSPRSHHPKSYSPNKIEYSLSANVPPTPVSYTTNSSFLDDQGVVSIDFSSSGRLMYACYTDLGCLIWDTLKAEVVGNLAGHNDRVTHVKSSPDGLAVVTASWDTTIKVWSPSYM